MKKNYILFIVFLFLFLSFKSFSQSDCSTAEQICNDGQLVFDPSGIGPIDDFANPNNDSGCLLSQEDNSQWFEITFDATMPPNSVLEFTATSVGTPVDTDFAMWGPNPDCSNLGSPITCNFSASDIAGLSNTGSNSGYQPGLVVQPGQTYLILINDYSGNGGAMSLTFDGTSPNQASDYIICDGCTISISTGPDINICQGGMASFSPTVNGNSGAETYVWTANPASALSYLSATNVLNPDILLPDGVAVNATYTITMTDGTCVRTDNITVTTLAPPQPSGGNPSFCSGTGVTLSPGSWSSYNWSTNATSPSITVSTSGIFTVTVTDGNGCEGVATYNVTELPPINVAISGGPTFCTGGSVVISAPGGYSGYLWNTNANTQSITVSTAGTYTVTVTDANMCTGVGSIVITEATTSPVAITPSGVLCSGGSISLDAGGGYMNYDWSTNETTQMITVSSAGTYGVTVEGSGGCLYEGTINVTQAAPLAPVISGTASFCAGNSTTLSVSGGSFTGYTWSDMSTGSTLTVSSPGTVSVTVTDANGCTGQTSLSVTENPLPTPSVSGDMTICPGIATTYDAGPGYSSYSWSGGGTGQTNVYNTPGTYGVTVTNANGCMGSTSFTITQEAPPTPMITGDLMICPGQTTTLDAGGGYVNYAWSGGGSGQTNNYNAPGTYSVTVTDVNGCTGTGSVSVSQNALPQPNITGVLSVCPQGNTSTTLDAGGGFVSYQWTGGGTLQTTTVNGPGSYTVTVTDGEGCAGEQTVQVNNFAVTSPTITGDNTLCPGQSTPLDAGSGFSGYNWSTGASTQQTTAAGLGTYSVTVTDNNGCETTGSFTATAAAVPNPVISGDLSFCEDGYTTLMADGGYISYNWGGLGSPNGTEYIIGAPGVVTLEVTNDEGCVGSTFVEVIQHGNPVPTINGNSTICQGETGFIDAGSGYASYAWNNSWNQQVLGVNDPGTYSVTVTDVNGCMGEASIDVNLAASLSVTISGNTQLCAGGSTTLSAGAGFNSYAWSNGLSSTTITVNSPGTYSVTVTNTTGCEGQASVTVTQGTPPAPVITGALSICEGGTTTLSLTGIYSGYSWTGGSSSSSYTATSAGTYGVTVTDANGCTGSTSADVTILPPAPITISGTAEVCEGGTTLLTADAGFASYEWSTGDTGQTLTVDTIGIYSVTGITASGCESVSEPLEVVLQPTDIAITGDTEFCEGSSVTLGVTPGFDTYVWSDGTMGATPEFTQAGTYTVTATSASGCTAQSTVTLTTNALPTVSIGGSTTYCPGGAAELSAEGVFAAYLWTDNSTNQTLTVTTAGTYGVTVTDNNGCEASAGIMVTEEAELSPVITGSLEYCEGSSTTLSAGSGYASYSWSTSDVSAMTEVTAPGQVTVMVTDAYGCSGQASVDVVENANPVLSIQGADNFCTGATATVFVDDIYTGYAWSDATTGPTTEVSTAGMISVSVTDVNGCVGSADMTVTENTLPVPSITGTLSYCPGTTTMLEGETGYVSYSWTGGETSTTLEVGAEGIYELTVEDDNGCVGSNMVTVSEYITEDPQITGVTDFCPGTTTTLEVSNAFAAYVWSTGALSPQIEADAATTYSVVVTDNNGCETTSDILTTIYTVTDPVITGDTEFCSGADVSLDAGPGYVTYNWSGTEATQQITVSSGGNYDVTVTDGNGCETTGSYAVTENALPVVVIGGSTSYCIGGFTTLDAGVYANYLWSDGSTTATINVSSAEAFSVTVTDDNGCVGENSVMITEDTELSPVISGPLAYCETTTTTLNAGSGFATYQWSDTSTGQTLQVSSPGTYSVTVTDSGGCIGETSVDVTENALPIPQITGVLDYCAGSATMLDAGAGYTAYNWSTGAGSQQLTVSSPGQYSVAVTSAEGCVDSTMVEVIENPLPTPQITGGLEYCSGAGTMLDAGAGFASYSWSTGAVSQDLSVSSPGNYSVVVSNGFGCIDSTSVAVTENPLPSPQISGNLDYCSGFSTMLDAGAGFTNYTWSTGSNSQEVEVNSPGSYSVAVSNGFGCVDSTTVVVTENALPVPQITGVLDYCAGSGTTLDAGVGFTSYSWSTGAGSQNLVVSSPGSYSVAVSNSFGCVDSTTVMVTENPLPVFAISGTTYYCEGSSTMLEVTGTFTGFEWTDNTSSSTIMVTSPGLMGVTVTNEYNCAAYEEVLVEEIALPVSAAGVDQDLDCEVLTTVLGSDLTSAGPAYTYVWTGPGINAANENMLHPEVDMEGQYSLVVTDTVHQCVSEVSMIGVEDLAYVPLVSLEVNDELDCITEMVLIDGSGSQSGPDILYSWKDGLGNTIAEGSEPMIEVSQADIYSMEVMDMATGCHNMDSVEVSQNIDQPLAVAGDPGHLDCNVLSYTLDGTASETGPNISYSWTTAQGLISSGGNTATPAVTQPGLYVLTVLNTENGCEDTDEVMVTQDIAAPIANAGADQEIDCHSESVTINASGTSTGSNIVFTWSYGGSPIGENSLIFEVSAPGVYTLNVENEDNGCSAQSQVLVTLDAAAPTGILAEFDSPTCFGDADGSIVISGVMGGSSPYLYSINGSPFTASPSYQGLTGGVYNLVVQDVAGCEYEQELLLEDGNDLQLDLGEDIYINLGDDAAVDAILNVDPAELMSIVWEAPGVVDCGDCLSFTVQPLTTTNYSITITDDNGCAQTEEITIFVNRPHEVFIPNVFSPNGDGNNDILTILGGKDIEKIHSFLIFNRWGENVFEVYDFPPNDSGFGWNGYDRGKVYNAQVFTYFAEVEFIDGEVVLFQGDVTLMR
ncbi:MAG: gliding motility-associated C-terminal domain-containing protein [Saprospiraceae bacterium]|nr:gliding motility-associated C-terminal domain-containing protein [Saprospiraceae bacterium]MCB9322776.1 gliding motility-associated C-terminal domain-containing protein [Lewinellaceae bacterium]